MGRKKNTDDGYPFFKFVISKYSTGNIQQCSLSAQGLFVNLCVLYWGQRGELYMSKMQKRFQRKQKQFDELLNEDVIKVNSDQIEITFLDEQLEELGLASQKNRENVQKRWNQRKQDTTVPNSNYENDEVVIPKEEKREEEKREEESKSNAHVMNEDDLKKMAIPPAEVLDVINAHCEFFSVSTDPMSPRYNAVVQFVEMLIHRGQYDFLKIAFESYKIYKTAAKEQIHGIGKWMGTQENYHNDGEWIMTDWHGKYLNLQKIGKLRGVPPEKALETKKQLDEWLTQ